MKKNLIILGGNSNKNKAWVNKLVNMYCQNYEVYALYYDNWENNKRFDFNRE